MAKADELSVIIKADTQDLEKGMQRSADSLATLGIQVKKAKGKTDELERSTTSLASVLKGPLAIAAAAAAAAMTGVALAVSKINDATGLKRTAERVNVNVERFQELSFAAKQVGVDSETLGDAIKDLNVKITDTAKNGGMLEDALKAIGLDAKELVDLAPEEQFRAFADAVAAASEETGNFAADEINDAMFQMLPLLRQGSAGLDEMAKEARDLNAVLSETELEEMERASREINKMNTAFDAMFNQLTLIVTGPLTSFAETVTGILKNLTGVSKTIDEIKQKTGPVASGTVQSGDVDLSATDTGDIKLGDVDEGALEAFRKEMAAKSGKIVLPSEMSNQGGGISDAEEAQAIDDIARILGLKKSSAEALGEAMEFQEEMNAAIQESKERAQILWMQTLKENMDEEIRLEEEKAAKKKRIAEMEAKAKADIMRNLTSLMNTESKKMFEIGKAAAVAQAIMNTHEGATKAMAQGGIWGWAQSAAILAAGFNNVNNIMSTSFGGAGGGAASTGGASGLGSDGSTTAAPSVQNVTEATINITGDIGTEGVRQLRDELLALQEDGGELVIK